MKQFIYVILRCCEHKSTGYEFDSYDSAGRPSWYIRGSHFSYEREWDVHCFPRDIFEAEDVMRYLKNTVEIEPCDDIPGAPPGYIIKTTYVLKKLSVGDEVILAQTDNDWS